MYSLWSASLWAFLSLSKPTLMIWWACLGFALNSYQGHVVQAFLFEIKHPIKACRKIDFLSVSGLCEFTHPQQPAVTTWKTATVVQKTKSPSSRKLCQHWHRANPWRSGLNSCLQAFKIGADFKREQHSAPAKHEKPVAGEAQAVREQQGYLPTCNGADKLISRLKLYKRTTGIPC